jgi:hypothetical protein
MRREKDQIIYNLTIELEQQRIKFENLVVELRSEINRLEIIEKTHLGQVHSLEDKLERLKDVEK